MSRPILPLIALLLSGTAAPSVFAVAAAPKPSAVAGPVATTRFDAGGFVVELRTDTQTLARLSPAADQPFSFVPTNREAERAGDGYNHLGDLHLRLRQAGAAPGEWQDFATAAHRAPVIPLPVGGTTLAAADISASLGRTSPLGVVRRWTAEKDALGLEFALTNRARVPIEIGVLGMPMVFDNIITGRDLDQAHSQASFADPYLGRDAGYIQVTRLNGHGPVLLVLPQANTPLEAYVPLKNPGEAPGSLFTDRSPRGQTSEGFYAWTSLSAGYREREWKNAGMPWNAPTSRVLAPGETLRVGVRLTLAPSIRAIEDRLVANGRPVAIGIPGYVVPTDQKATLFVKAPSAITRIESQPADALVVEREAGAPAGWTRLAIRTRGFGPARLTLGYADGQQQTVSYYATRPLDRTVADLGRFSTTRQWFDGKGDPFHRTPAILTYDREANRIVATEPRVWIAGMSDEGGAGSWVAAAMKQLDNPAPEEVRKLEELIDGSVVGQLQIASGPHMGAVRKSLFFYAPAKFPQAYSGFPSNEWKSWTAWNEKDAGDLGRAYNYPHVAIGHWVLYRTARNHPGLVTHHDWRWYLEHAYLTATAMMRDAPYYTQFGLMEGDVFVDILDDLKREGMTPQATELERLMKRRADHWATLKYPFGSEMAWDSTGQPEVYAWMRYFNHAPQAGATREVILGYDPTVPSWGYNGNARRYWDFLYGGKWPRIERQIHHYGSALNAVPLFDAYRHDPADLHLLRVAYGGMMGGITNIGEDGSSSAAFHSWPDTMKWDPYSGDFGMGFYGHAIAAATYLVNDPRFGWLGFGGSVEQKGDEVTIVPQDGARSRLFLAPAGQWITLEAGKIARAVYQPKTKRLLLTLDPATSASPVARLFVENTIGRPAYVPKGAKLERGGYTVELGGHPVTIELG